MSWVEAGSFSVSGDPVPQPRPRFRIQKTSRGRAIARVYIPKRHKVHEWRLAVHWEARRAGVRIITGPVMIELMFRHRWPQRRKGLSIQRDRKPDFDNLAKAVVDALTGIAWRDDAQVSRAIIETRHDDEPGVDVKLYCWGGDDDGAILAD